MRRIFISGLYQETNTFCPQQTDLDAFQRGFLLDGQEIPEKLRGTNTEIGGFYRFLETRDTIEITPGGAAWAVTSGKIKEETLKNLTEGIISKLLSSLPVDGVLLSLHGAMVSEILGDSEGYLLQAVRNCVGPTVPVVCSLDYHALISDRMVELADILVGYRTYPHVDFRETGEKAARLLLTLMDEKLKITPMCRKLPMILPVENTEPVEGPVAGVMECLKDLDNDPLVLSSSFFCPHPWLDVKDFNITILIYTRASATEAYTRVLEEIAGILWTRRDEFFREYPSAADFFRTVGNYEKPVLLVDSGDITSAGGCGDSTEILRESLKKGDLRVVIPLVDPDTARRAFQLGEHGSGEFSVGGSGKEGYNQKVSVVARIAHLSAEPVTVTGESFYGLQMNLGKRVRLDIEESIHLLVSEYSSFIHDPNVLRSMCLKPEECDIIVQKSHKLFRAGYKDIAGSIAIIDTPGYTDRNILRLPFSQLKDAYPLKRSIAGSPQHR